MDQWVGQEAYLRWSAHCLGGAACRDRAHYTASDLWHLRNGSWFVAFLYPIDLIAPSAHACSYF